MKSISDILNLLATPPSDGASLLKGGSSVSGKGSQSNGNSFGDLLTQLANQQDKATTNQSKSDTSFVAGSATGNQAAPNADTTSTNNAPTISTPVDNSGSLIAVSQTDISITETIQSTTVGQLVQAEQSLATLATGLSKLLNLFSNLQNMDLQQAQNAIVALSGGRIAPSDAMGLLNAIQQITQKDPSQNPLLMTPDQQNTLLSQAFQQMLQGQQLALGTLNNIPGAVDSTQIGNVVLQMSFSDTSIAAIQQTGSQSSQVYINLESFQMSATFIQAGSQQGSGRGVAAAFQPLPQAVSDPLLQSFNQALLELAGQSAGAVTNGQVGVSSSTSLPTLSTDTATQTFKNLVQLLVQSGASQAVLTSYMNQAAPQSTSGPSQSQVQNTALDNFLNNLTLVAQNPNLGSAYAASSVPVAPSTDNASSTILGMGNANFMVENITQTSILMEAQTVLTQSKAGLDQASTSQTTLDIQMSAVSLSLFDANIQGVVAPPLDPTNLNSLNDAVARFNLASLQLDQTSVNSTQTQPLVISVDQILANLEAVQGTAGTSQSDQVLNPAPLVIENLNVFSQPLSTPASGLNEQNLNLMDRVTVDLNFSAGPSAVLSTSANTASAVNDNVTTASQQNANSTGTLSNAPIQVALQETVGANGINVQVQLTNGSQTVNLAANDSQNGASTTAPGLVSTAQNISVSLLAGETVKNSTQTQSNSGDNLNTQSNIPTLVLSTQTVSEVKPIIPEGVLATGSASQSGANLNLNVNIQDAQASTVIEVASSLLAAGSTVTTDKTHLANSTPNSSAPNLANGSINSAQILNQITEQIAAQAADARTVSRLSFQLVPESLGRVTIQIALIDQSVSARIIVSNPEVKEAIQHHMVDLKAALNQSGLQIDQLQVQVQGGGANLLAQYYQYQQEGFGYRLPAGALPPQVSDINTLESDGGLDNLSVQLSLVNVLA